MRTNRLKIIFEDRHLLVVYKPSNLLTIKSNNCDKSLYNEVLNYLHKKNQKVFIVHRLDKDTSGLVIFAKSEKVKEILQNNWDSVSRNYIAVVHGKVKESDIIKSYIAETNTLYSYSTTSKNGKYAETHYKPIKNNDKFSLIDINIKTGRKNQIRVHMSDNNTPIVGDKKYGIKDNIKTMYLLANKLEFIHPITTEKLFFNLGIPNDYLEMVK